MAGMLIIGAGECGVRAAFALREQGYEGAITLLGAETTLPYERPPLSKGGAGAVKPIREASAYEAARIDLYLGVSALQLRLDEKQVHLTDGGPLSYDKLLIATGARARIFSALAGCMTLRTDEDAQKIHSALKPGARIGIIGGGFIGLELAAIARERQCEVTVIEAAPRLLGRAVPAEIAQIIQDRHEAAGVRLFFGQGVRQASLKSIVLGDGEALEFDLVVAGVGAVPNTELAESAGLKVENGIVVDSGFRASDPHVFAAGDCCNFEWQGARVRLESWKAAQDQGAHAAAAMLGAQEPSAKVPYFWSDQYDLTLQAAGIFDLTRSVQSRPSGQETRIVFQCDAEGRLVAAAGIGVGNSAAKDLRILEKLIERGARVDAAALADPDQNLKRFLKAA